MLVANPSLNITTIDINDRFSKPAVDYLKQQFPEAKINFIHGDAETYKFKNYFYNLVYSRFGVMFFNNPKIAFTNIRKSMGVKGKLIFLSWNKIERC